MKLLVMISLLLPTVSLYSQTHSCCQLDDPAISMSHLAGEPAFARLHIEPLPFPNPEALRGVTITYPTADEKQASGYLVKQGDTSKVLFVFHEWWGLNEYIKSEADRLSSDLGITVFALDLYDGNVAPTREQAQQYMRGLTVERGLAIVNGAYQYFGMDKKYATIGWCMGGAWSLKAAISGFRYKVVGCVMYYGMPERNPDALDLLNAPVLGIFATRDQSITPEIVKEAKTAFKKAGKKFTVHFYDAVHAFANPSNPNYDRKSAADAYKKSLRFLKKQFKVRK